MKNDITMCLESFDIQSTNVIGLDGPKLSKLPSTTPHYSNEMRNISILILRVIFMPNNLSI
jgi:hypothetical protein